MAGSSLLALIDDIATILDDVAVLTKVSAKKTAGVLGDDLALNAEQVSGVVTDRELPVVWAVAKGSAVNKLILVPAALAISAFIPWAVTPLLMVGGSFLCYEGAEKLAHKLFANKAEEAERHTKLLTALVEPAVDSVALERDKIKGAIRTDFVLSAEIVAIALGVVADEPFATQLGVLATMAAVMTVGVYGLVAGIVKLDDLGLLLKKRGEEASSPSAKLQLGVGNGILRAAPYLMKGLGIAGTIAMFLVGGGILAHGIPGVESFVHGLSEGNALLGAVLPTLANGIIGVLAGAVIVGIVSLIKRGLGKQPSAAA